MNAVLISELTKFIRNVNKVMEGEKVLRQTVNYTGSQQWQFVSRKGD